jgi:outer membrane protein
VKNQASYMPARSQRWPDWLGCDQLVEPSELEAKTFPKISKEFKIGNMMISKFVRTAAVLLGLSLLVLAQFAVAQAQPAASPAAAPAQSTPPDAPSAAPANTGQLQVKATGTKVGTINIEQAIFASNEGQRDFQALSKKFEPKQAELKNSSDEIDSLQKQLSAQTDKLNDDAREKLMKQIEGKKKAFDRAQQDAQEDFQGQQGEIGNRILTKMAPLIVKYAADHEFGLILDTSQQWPRSPVLWNGPAVDITAPIVEAYNTQSGVPAPAGGTTPVKKPTTTGAATKPASPASKPTSTTPNK